MADNDAVIRIEGLDEVLAKITTLQEMRPVKAALKAAALHVKGKIDTYPPASEANSPLALRWYERGYGPKWRVKDGTIHSRRSSETLGRRWTIGEENAGLTYVVGNNVSYAPYVHGPGPEKPRQAKFHAARGWKTTVQVAEEEREAVKTFVIQHIERELAK